LHGSSHGTWLQRRAFSEADLALLWEALQGMFEQDRSAERWEMAPQTDRLPAHNPQGNALRTPCSSGYASCGKTGTRWRGSFSDYAVKVNKTDMSSGVTLLELL
jgi:CRISPR-associated protein Csd2